MFHDLVAINVYSNNMSTLCVMCATPLTVSKISHGLWMLSIQFSNYLLVVKLSYATLTHYESTCERTVYLKLLRTQQHRKLT